MIARTRELAELQRVLTRTGDRGAAVLVAGETGIGKTTLWDAAVAAASQNGLRVLTARGSRAETTLTYAALIDLLEGVGDDELATLPEPQLRALTVALIRAEPHGPVLEGHAVSLGLLTALRTLATDDRLVIAVDDLHLLDEGSAGALAYVARRTTDQPITWLLAKRAGTSSVIEASFAAGDLDHVDLVAPDLDDLGRILLDQLGLRLSRHQLRRVFDLTRGNPLFAVEVGRMVAASGRSPGETADDLPVPARVDELFGQRVAQLDQSLRRVLLALALQADLRVGLLASIVGPKPLDDAIAAGLAVVDGDRVRPAHPLLAASAMQQSSPGQRRELNAALATVGDGRAGTGAAPGPRHCRDRRQARGLGGGGRTAGLGAG